MLERKNQLSRHKQKHVRKTNDENMQSSSITNYYERYYLLRGVASICFSEGPNAN